VKANPIVDSFIDKCTAQGRKASRLDTELDLPMLDGDDEEVARLVAMLPLVVELNERYGSFAALYTAARIGMAWEQYRTMVETA